MDKRTKKALIDFRDLLPVKGIEINENEAKDKNGNYEDGCYYDSYESRYYVLDEKATMANFEEILLKSIILNTKAINTIKNCIIYFTTISIIGLIISFFVWMTTLYT